MKKILIAEPSEEHAYYLVRLFQARYEVHVCHTGDDALRLLEELQPEGLIIDLFLVGIDALTVLRTTPYIPPVIIALTRHFDPAVSNAAALCGVGYLFMIPYSPRALAKRMDEMMQA